MKFDWHAGTILRTTEIDGDCKNTQNVRRFLITQCGMDFKFYRGLMAKIMGDVADECAVIDLKVDTWVESVHPVTGGEAIPRRYHNRPKADRCETSLGKRQSADMHSSEIIL